MATARSVARVALADAIGLGEYTALTTTSAGNANKLTLVDSALSTRDANFCANWWVVLPTGPTDANGSYEAKEVSSFTGSTITVASAFTALVASGVSYELHRYNPALYHKALNAACRLTWPHLYTPKRNETLMVDNLLSNWDFETWNATTRVFSGWAETGNAEISAHTTIMWHGALAARITGATASNTYRLRQGVTINVDRIISKGINFYCRVWTMTASQARIRVQWGASAFSNSDWHAGDGTWRLLKVATTVPSTYAPGSFYVLLELVPAANNEYAYFDACWLAVDHIYRYTIPSAIIKGPYTLSLEQDWYSQDGIYLPKDMWHQEEDGSGRYIVLDQSLPSGYIMRIEGIGTLTEFTSSDTSTTEVDSPRTELLIARAALWMYESLRADSGPEGKEYFDSDVALWRGRYAELLMSPGMKMTPLVAQVNRRWAYG